MSAQEVLQLIMLDVNNKATTLNILNLQYLPENAEGLMSAIDVIDHIYFCLLVLFKVMWRMPIVCPAGFLFLTVRNPRLPMHLSSALEDRFWKHYQLFDASVVPVSPCFLCLHVCCYNLCTCSLLCLEHHMIIF